MISVIIYMQAAGLNMIDVANITPLDIVLVALVSLILRV